MTREDGVRLAEEILGGKWDYAVRARATWLWARDGWAPEDETFIDLTRHEAACDSEIERSREAHRNMMALAAFNNAVTS